METTIFLAKFWGWFLVILCLVFLSRKKMLSEEMFRLIENKGHALLFGYLALIIGLVTVILHSVWVADWRVVITILGWVSLIRGVVIIGFSGVAQKFLSIYKDKPALMQILLVICLLLGGWLIWMSY